MGEKDIAEKTLEAYNDVFFFSQNAKMLNTKVLMKKLNM